ncbi:MAG: MlaE family lipid ABC transporter permease subunit [Desulfonatronovibrio sp. MSAO_Bac4]|nr:MAG: MlaE family lipid ABC transporter permease subunit [Desulfonatronovibrio sp. MSAO_Bac4]
MPVSEASHKDSDNFLSWSFERPEDNTSSVYLNGSLNTQNLSRLWQETEKRIDEDNTKNLIIDAGKVNYLDMSGQAYLLHFSRLIEERGGKSQIKNLRKDFADMLGQLSCFDCMEKTAYPKSSILEEIGKATIKLGHDARDFFTFVGQFVSAFSHALIRPGTIRWKDVYLNIENVGAKAVFIVCLIGFLMGLIISFQSAMPLRMFGAEIFVARLLGLSMVRELGPLVTAIILAGRTGSSFAAEIGTMKINEEINALTTMGLNPVKFLVVPRMLATMLVMPFLTLFFIIFSLIGGALVMLSLGFPLITYINQITMSLTMADFAGGMFKAVIFSLLVSWIGCVRGLQTTSGAKAVGLSTTSAVVSGIVLIAITDGIFAVTFYILGI